MYTYYILNIVGQKDAYVFQIKLYLCIFCDFQIKSFNSFSSTKFSFVLAEGNKRESEINSNRE